MNKKITIGFLIVDEHSGQGGLENVLVDITTGLKEINIHSKVLMLYPPKKREFIHKFTDIDVLPLSWIVRKNLHKRLPHFLYYPVWKYLFKKSAKSFLKRHYHPSNIDALVILNLSKNLLRVTDILNECKRQYPHIPIISWPHGTITTLSPKVRASLQKKIGLVDHFLAISNGLAEEFEESYSAKNISIIYNPVAPASSVPRSANNFIYIGRIGSPDKRVKALLSTLQRLKGDWSLDLIGASDSKENDQAIIAHAVQLGIIDRIKIHGWQEQPWECVQDATALLLNSESEGFGLVLVEAMMRGIPCVSSDCPVGPSEIIKEGENGWLYDLNDDQRCLTILQGIIDKTLPLPPAEKIQESVRQFSTEIVINNFKDAVLSAISQKAEHKKR